MTITTIVLAAGRGLRLGGPKALLAYPVSPDREVPLAAAHAERRCAAESDQVLIVTRADIAAALGSHAPGLEAEIVISSAPDADGPAGSIQAAWRHLAGGGTGPRPASEAAQLVVISPVDCPPAQPGTVRVLLDALADHPELLAARPRCGPRRGHPVVLRLTALAPFGATRPPPLRDLLRGLGDQVADVDVADPMVLLDLDHPDDQRAWAQSQGLEMSGPPRFFWP